MIARSNQNNESNLKYLWIKKVVKNEPIEIKCTLNVVFTCFC